LGFRPVVVVGRHVQKQEIDSTKGKTIHKSIQNNTKSQNIQNKKQKANTKIIYNN
jgi:hypothetical protein